MAHLATRSPRIENGYTLKITHPDNLCVGDEIAIGKDGYQIHIISEIVCSNGSHATKVICEDGLRITKRGQHQTWQRIYKVI